MTGHINNNDIKAIVFDLDNTLYDHAHFVDGAYSDVAKLLAQNRKCDAASAYTFMLSLWREKTSHWHHVFSEALERFGGYEQELEREMVSVYHSYRPNALPLYEDSEPVLRSLTKKYALCLLSDGRKETQHAKIEALGLAEIFCAIVITGQYGREYYKPHRKAYDELAKQISLSGKALLYVGDDPHKDFSGAKKSGYTTIRVRQGEYRNIEPRSEDEFADVTVNTLRELHDLLMGNDK